jgi:hypothetical protein
VPAHNRSSTRGAAAYGRATAGVQWGPRGAHWQPRPPTHAPVTVTVTVPAHHGGFRPVLALRGAVGRHDEGVPAVQRGGQPRVHHGGEHVSCSRTATTRAPPHPSSSPCRVLTHGPGQGIIQLEQALGVLIQLGHVKQAVAGGGVTLGAPRLGLQAYQPAQTAAVWTARTRTVTDAKSGGTAAAHLGCRSSCAKHATRVHSCATGS